jgi:conjugative transfer pilus assembly protein TraH
MNAWKKATAALVLALAPVGVLHADLNSQMQEMFDSLGVYGNYSSPTSFTAQNRGYLVGGGVSVRSPIRSITPVGFQRPQFAAGCGGIDMHLGSVSFASIDAYENFFRSLPTVALGYGLKVGLDAISPTLRRAFDNIEDIVNKINSYAMNSCQAAQAAFTGAAGLIESANLERCKRRKMKENAATDAAAAEKQCKDSPEDVSDGASDVEALKPVKGNIVWKALLKIDGLTTQDRELIMSIFGTVVIKTGQDPLTLPPTIPTFKDFFHGMPPPGAPVQGAGTHMNVYRCDTVTECLNPSGWYVPVTTFPKRVEERMQSIVDKLLQREPQDELNIGFINGIRIPVFRMLVFATANNDSVISAKMISDYKDLIAIDLAVSYVDRLIAEASTILKSSKGNSSTVEAEFLQSLATIGETFKEAAREERGHLAQREVQQRALLENIEHLQRQMHDMMPENVRRLLAAGR